MSPTYWTASRIKLAARAHGWEFVPCSNFSKAWGCRKSIRHSSPAGRRYDYTEVRRVMFEENRRGGLIWVRTQRMTSGSCDVEYYGPRFANKLDVVLDFLCKE